MVNIVSIGLLLFWGVYFVMAGTGNFVDWLTEHGYRGKFFRFSSRNLEMLERVASKYHMSQFRVGILFGIITCWELLSAVLYLLSSALLTQGEAFLVQYAFFTGMGFFAALTLGNEAFIFYENEEEHVVLLVAQLISYLAIVILAK